MQIGIACIEATIAAIEGKTSKTKVNFPYVLVDYQTQALGKKLIKELS